MKSLPIVYDTKGKKTGFVIPRDMNELETGQGVCRYFSQTEKCGDYQTRDCYMIQVGVIPIEDRNVQSYIRSFLERDSDDLSLQEFYKTNGILQ